MKTVIQFVLLIMTISLAACQRPGASCSPSSSYQSGGAGYYSGNLSQMEHEENEGEMRNIR